MTANEIIARQEKKLGGLFSEIDKTVLFNQEKVLNAFREENIALRHFLPSTGYGYGDEGKERLGRVYARAFGAESAVVSPAILSGTHALTVALFGILRPQDKALCITGMPYDTIRGVIWGKENGSLADFGVRFDVTELTKEGKVDYSADRKSVV